MIGALQAQNWEWMRQVRTPYTEGSEGKFIGRDAQCAVYTAGLFSGSAAFGDSLALTSLGGSDIFLAKYSADHRAQWVRRIGSLGNQYPGDAVTAMSVDKNGNVYLAGTCTGPFILDADTIKSVPASVPSAFLVKYLPNGTLGWHQLWDSGRCPAMATDTAGNLYLAVTVAADSIYLRKYAPDSTRLWSKPCLTKEGPYAPPVNAVVNGMVVGDSGEVFICGHCAGTLLLGGLTDFTLSTTSPGDQDGFMAKFNANGMPRWGVVDGLGSSSDNVAAIATDGNGHLCLTGNNGAANNGIFTAKYTAAGKEVWRTKPLKSTSLDVPAAMCVRRATGHVYVAGHFADTMAFTHTQEVADSFFSEKNNTWSRYVRTVALDTCLALAPAFGATRQNGIFIVWFDSTGKYTGHFQNSTFGGEELRQAMMDENGNLYATGFSRNSALFGPDTLRSSSSAGDCFTAKFSPAAAPPTPDRGAPQAVRLDLAIQNIPNPLGAGTTIRFTVPEKAQVLLAVNKDGKRVAVLENRVMPAGSYAVKFDTAKLAAGTYQCSLTAGEDMVVRDLSVVR
jgi:hypothetical protein